MRPLVLFLIVGLLASCATRAPRAPQDMSEKELTSELLHVSGVHGNMHSMPEILRQSVQQRMESKQIDEQTASLLFESMGQAFEPEKLLVSVHKVISEGIKREEKEQIISWYRSPIGSDVRGLEVWSETTEGQTAFQDWLQQLEDEKVDLSDEDISFAREVAVLSGSLDTTVDTVSAVAIGTLVGLNSTLPMEKRLSPMEINKQVLLIRQKLTESLAPTVVLSCLFTYGKLDFERRAQLLSFLEKGAGRHFVEAVGDAVRGSFEMAAVRVGEGIGRGMASIEE